MKVVILAAGIGSRLHPETLDKPKAMVEINKKPLVQYQVESALSAGFDHEDIYIVTGYMMERLNEYFCGAGVKFIYNPNYQSMNNIYSFLLTREIGDDLILINSDDFYDPRMISMILDAHDGSSIMIDRKKTLTQESMRVKLKNNRVQLVNKKIELYNADGEYIGISKLRKDDLKILYRRAFEMVESGQVSAWYEHVYEACASEVEITAVDTRGYAWIEIDDLHDYEYAKQLAPLILPFYGDS